jgi:hypothetical protein
VSPKRLLGVGSGSCEAFIAAVFCFDGHEVKRGLAPGLSYASNSPSKVTGNGDYRVGADVCRHGDREVNPSKFTELLYESRVLVQQLDAGPGAPKAPQGFPIGGKVDPSRRIVVIVVRLRSTGQKESLGDHMSCAGLLYQLRRERTPLDL